MWLHNEASHPPLGAGAGEGLGAGEGGGDRVVVGAWLAWAEAFTVTFPVPCVPE